ncbi:MAG: phosphate ABC transporter permease subunit PstC [Frankiaceae bacterium]|nr:phosphate ABC transporter permease subunit PstC [Frankiaceae bacterium]MBV9368881.1 phosphate ABC transporter permease subunit PstC [Frankiales bacterium]
MSTIEGTPRVPRLLISRRAFADKVFRGSMRTAAVAAVAILGLIALFLVVKAMPALRRTGWSFLTETRWLPYAGHFGVAALVSGTIAVALIAMAFALPVAFGAALFISEYAPVRLRRSLIGAVDLMAAVPSIVYGLWGFFWLQPHLIGVSRWVAVHIGDVVPFLSVRDPSTPSSFTSSAFVAGVVVSVMVVPTATSVMREVFSQAPVAEREAAIALGATRWGMIRKVVLPFGRSGVVGGAMLGLGRALGETIAVYLIISPIFALTTHPLQSGTNTIAALIAAQYSEANGVGISALFAAGLVLFLFTLVVNSIAGFVVSRSRSGAVTEI